MRLAALAAGALALAACEPSGPAAPASGAAARGESASVSAPDFSLPDLAGGTLALAELRGRPVVIDFWATWCAPCERQIPVLNAFHAKHGERIPVLGISVDVDAAAVAPFVNEHDVRYRVLLGDEGLAREYGALGFPTLFVVRPDGRIHSAHVGVVSPEALEEAVAEWSGGAQRRAPRALKSPPAKVEDRDVAAPPRSAAPNPLADTGARIRSVFERSFRAGELVYDEGWEGDALFVIQAGQVELIRNAEGGQRVISRHGPGEFFGEMGVLLGRPRSARAVAISDLRLLQLDGRTFEEMCVERPEIAIRVIQRLAARTIHLEQRLAALGADDLLRPLVRVLVRRAERTQGTTRIETSLRKLAEEAGVSLVEAHRALAHLMDQRLVRLVEDVLWIADLDALSAVLDPGD